MAVISHTFVCANGDKGKMTFSEHLFQLRTARKLTQKGIAEKIGVSWRAYQNYELGLREPQLSTLVALADFYEISLDELACRRPPAAGAGLPGDSK